MKKNVKNGVLAAGLLILSSSAFSEFYVGGNIGKADQENTGDSTSWEIKTGYRFNDYVAVEGFYLDLGSTEISGPDFNLENEISGVGVSVLGLYPINEQFEVYGKLGIYSWDGSSSITTDVVSGFDLGDESGEDFIYGVGVAWKLSDMVKLNLGYDAVSFGDYELDTDIYSIGATVSF